MSAHGAGDGPFLSVVVPAGTIGEQALRETLLCLAAQDDVDFEVLLTVPADGEAAAAAARAVADQPALARERVRIVRAPATTPGAARNAGLAEARGRYVAVLPAGDLVLGSWVGVLHAAETSSGGGLLRTVGVTQDHVMTEVAGLPAVRAVGSPLSTSPARFSLWQHAAEPLTPPAAWAWPRSLVEEHHVAYDETVSDDPDWELLVRLAQLVGVVDLETVTSLRRGWSDAAVPTHDTAREAIDARPLVLPPGEVRRLQAEAPQSEATRELTTELETSAELIRLKDDHIRNIEAQLDERDARLAHVRGLLDKRTAQVEKLRARLRAATPDEATGRPAKERERGRGRGGWRRRS